MVHLVGTPIIVVRTVQASADVWFYKADSLQVTLVINPAAVGCHYFLPGPRLPSQLQIVTTLAR